MAGSFVQTPGTECDENAIPIAGTSGFENARSALRTNAQTYSAAAYAENNILPNAPNESKGKAAFEFFSMFKAAEIATYESKATTDKGTNCPAEYGVSLRPVDLQAMAMGVSFQKGAWGGFYAASVAYGNPSLPNQYVRGMLAFAQPIYATYTLIAAPLARNGYSTQQGASAFALDWVAGATYNSSLMGFRVGYAGSRGLYAGVTESKLGVFASGVLGRGENDATQLGFFRLGLDRAELDKVKKGLGLTSLFVRDIPFGLDPADQGSADLVPDQARLRTTHFAQQNIGGVFDVAATWATRPTSQLYDAHVAYHSQDYVQTRRLKKKVQQGTIWSIQGGLVSLPGQATLGLEGGTYFSGRLDVGAAGGSQEGRFRGGGSLLLNDAEVLALYPYAVNAVTFRIGFDGDF